MQRQRQRTESTTSTLPKRMAKSPTDLHGTRLSMNTVIEMQHHDGSTAGNASLPFNLIGVFNSRRMQFEIEIMESAEWSILH